MFPDLQNSPIAGAWTRSRCAHLWSKKLVLFQETEVGKDLTPTTARKIVRTMVYRYRKRKPAWDLAPGRKTLWVQMTVFCSSDVGTNILKKILNKLLQRSFYSFETSELHSGNDIDALIQNQTALQQNKVSKKEGDGDTVRPTSKKTPSNKILLSRELNGNLLKWPSVCLSLESFYFILSYKNALFNMTLQTFFREQRQPQVSGHDHHLWVRQLGDQLQLRNEVRPVCGLGENWPWRRIKIPGDPKEQPPSAESHGPSRLLDHASYSTSQGLLPHHSWHQFQVWNLFETFIGAFEDNPAERQMIFDVFLQ